jgi:hypothetical protein
MRIVLAIILFASSLSAQTASPELPSKDAVRIREFYRLASQIQDKVWPGWSKIPAPLLLVTKETEFLTHHPAPPKQFEKVGDDVYARPRQFSTGLLATFPAFGPPSVIVIGEPENTDAKSSTPWLIVVMHEHFHQLQDSHPGIYEAVNGLGLAHGDTTGMWMLNYPFPYDRPELGKSFAQLRDLLLAALAEPDGKRFKRAAREYVQARKRFLEQLSSEDRRYWNFQLWKEGIARYVQIKSAEAASRYQPSREFAALPDYEPFDQYARHIRQDTLNELGKSDLARSKRLAFYAFGATEGLLLDRSNAGWKQEYFAHLFTLDPYFVAAR